MRIKRAIAFSVLGLLIAGPALWFGCDWLWPPKLSNLAWTEFESADGGMSSIYLPIFNTVIEEMFAGYREEPTSKEMLDTSGAMWKVTLTDTDGSKRHLVVRRRGDGYIWAANKVEHPALGDIELVIAAHQGIELLSKSQADGGIAALAFQDDGENSIRSLINLAKTRSVPQRVVALRELNVILSPRISRENRLAAGYKPGKVVNVPLAIDHPRAAEVRAIALAAVNEAYSGKLSTRDEYWLGDAALNAICEVADQEALNALAELLRVRADADHHSERIMEAIEAIYGLPPFVQLFDFCPTGETSESIARAGREALARRRERRQKLLEWHDLHRNTPLKNRLEMAVASWEPIINARDPYTMAGFPMFTVREFRPLLRQGDSVVSLLRGSQSRVPDISHKANYELLIALITGDCDTVLISQLSTGDLREKEIARRISDITEAD